MKCPPMDYYLFVSNRVPRLRIGKKNKITLKKLWRQNGQNLIKNSTNGDNIEHSMVHTIDNFAIAKK